MGYKIGTDLETLTTPAVGDKIPVVDVSDTTQSADGSTKVATLQVISDLISGEISVPVKATAAEVNTGTDDAKFATPLAIKTAKQTVTSYTPAAAGTSTLDLTTGNIHKITMPNGNITIAISNEAVGQCFLIEITQDGVGSRTVTWFTTIRWAGGSAPTLTTTASKRDVLGFRVTGTDTYDAYVVGQNI